jgi:nitrilase
MQEVQYEWMSSGTGTPSGAVRVAIVQQPPVLLYREATLARAVAHLHEAADNGARLVVFPEAYVPGYPVWIWQLRPGPDYALTSDIHRALLANAVNLDSDDLEMVRCAARDRELTIVCGVHERDGAFGRSTLYNTLVTIGSDGALLNCHRKLVPTNPERMVWGEGDGRGLRVVATDVGRVGGLICWENYMPLARVALYSEGIEIYVASTWDSGDVWVASLRHIAAEGRCWVLGSGCSLQVGDVPSQFPDRERLFGADEDRWLNPGDSVVVRPGGELLAGPLHREHGILYADIEPGNAAVERRTLDVVGHYARNDVFELVVDRSPKAPITDRRRG